jgi:ABC-type dipeptide/oligopeptide/nickel transport system permease subunit
MRAAWRRLRRNRLGLLGGVLVAIVVFVAVFCPVIAPYDPNDQSAMMDIGANHAPTEAHPLGTDRLGYDVLSRVAYGAPTALAVGLGAMTIATAIGLLVGGIAGYAGGWLDELLMRLTEFVMVLPVFLVILAMVRLFSIIVIGTWLENVPHLNLMTVIALLGAFGWPPIARLVRGEFLRLRQAEFVEAARCIGATASDIVWRHILPNALPPVAVAVALGIGGAVLAEAMISFLGFGDPGSPSWGQLLFFNYEVLKIAPWSSLAPAAAIFITVLGFNLFADGLADALDPRRSK